MSPGRAKGRTTSQRTGRSVAQGSGGSGSVRRRRLVDQRGSGDGGGTGLAKASREERIEERGGGDQRGVRAVAQHGERAPDRPNASHGGQRPTLRPRRVPPRHLFD